MHLHPRRFDSCGRRKGRRHPIEVDQIAANQHIFARDSLTEGRGKFGIGKKRNLQPCVERLCHTGLPAIRSIILPVSLAEAIADCAGIARQHLVALSRSDEHRTGHGRRQPLVRLREQPRRAECVVELDARGHRLAPLEPPEELFQILLLVPDDIALIRLLQDIGDGNRRLHAAQCLDQLVILRLGLVEQDIDPDGLRAHRIEIAQRLDQNAAIERLALRQLAEDIIVIFDQQDSIILLHSLAACDFVGAEIVHRRLGLRDHRHRPPKPRDEQRGQHKHDRQPEPPWPGLSYIAPPSADEALFPCAVFAQIRPPRGIVRPFFCFACPALWRKRGRLGNPALCQPAYSASDQASTGLRAACVSSSLRRGA